MRTRRCEPAQHERNEASWRHDRNTLADLADYEWLTSDQAEPQLAEASTSDAPTHQLLGRLRKALSAERAGLVVQQIELRKRAAAKFGERAERMFFTDIGLQQSTDLWIARYKASRVPEGCNVVDYCTGIGGDLLAFAELAAVRGWDCAPEVAHVANANLRAIEPMALCSVGVGLVEEQPPLPDEVWHLDPDRRTDGRRSTQLQWHSPSPELVDDWLSSNPDGILKLAPATDVPERWSEQAELEWISRDRQCRQQVAWFGRLANQPGIRRATVVMPVADGQVESASFMGSPDEVAPIGSTIRNYIYDTDPAIRAAGLTGSLASALGLDALHAGGAYLTSDVAVDHPLISRFEVLDQLPLRVKPLAKHLRSLGVGRLEIKKRGVDTDPERLRKQLKLSGERTATLLLARVEARELAIVARRDVG